MMIPKQIKADARRMEHGTAQERVDAASRILDAALRHQRTDIRRRLLALEAKMGIVRPKR